MILISCMISETVTSTEPNLTESTMLAIKIIRIRKNFTVRLKKLLLSVWVSVVFGIRRFRLLKFRISSEKPAWSNAGFPFCCLKGEEEG